MGKYRLLISTTAQKTLKSLPQEILPKVVKAIQGLSINPYPQGNRKLSGEENTYRIRVGVYRIIYEVDNKEIIILILKIGHRKDVYR